LRRFRWVFEISLAIALIATTGPVAFAGSSAGGVPPGGNRVLRGKTSQGLRIQVAMNRIRGGWGVQELDFGIDLKCQDGERISGGMGIFWGAPQHPVQDERFVIDEVNSDIALHFHGRIGPRAGSGTIELAIPVLTSDEKAQTCTSKERTWTLKRTSPALDASCCAPEPTAGRPAFAMTARVEHGAVHVTRSMNVGEAGKAALRRARHYSGSTSQDMKAKFTTEQFDANRRVVDLSFGFGIRCQDGTGFTLGTGWGFGGHTGPRLNESGSFGFDSVDIFEGFHVHGRLGAHAGSGTAADNMPALTQDEQAMLCTSKERDWEVKREARPVPVGTAPSATEVVRTTSR